MEYCFDLLNSRRSHCLLTHLISNFIYPLFCLLLLTLSLLYFKSIIKGSKAGRLEVFFFGFKIGVGNHGNIWLRRAKRYIISDLRKKLIMNEGIGYINYKIIKSVSTLKERRVILLI